jgi:hypothetical protein
LVILDDDINVKEAQRRVDELMKIIRWIDDYRVFKVADPANIEASIQKFCPSDLITEWKRVKKDIKDMNEALTKSPLRKLMVISIIMRLVAMTTITCFIVLLTAVIFFRVKLNLSYSAVVTIALFCLVVIPNFYLYLDRYVRIKIREYHENLKPKFLSRMEKVKDFAQNLIFCMNAIIREHYLNPDKNKFRLRNCDYKGLIRVKKQRFSEVFVVKPLIE